MKVRTIAAVAALAALAAVPARAETVGTSFPDDFPVPTDQALRAPVIGFGAKGAVSNTPVIFLHGNNDTPYPTSCNGAYGSIHGMAQFFADHGYATSELWGLGYQGDQCDLLLDQNNRSEYAHSTIANVADLDAFVRAVLTYTGAEQVSIVGHSLGVTLAREWMRQANTYGLVRGLVGVDGPNHGIINCSPDPANYWQLVGSFNPSSAICQEYGSDRTPLLAALNAGDDTPGPTEYMMIHNADTSFVFYDRQDGVIPPVPAQDYDGNAHSFNDSAMLEPDGNNVNVPVYGQGVHDPWLGTTHLGIINSQEVWTLARDFLVGLEP